MIYIMSGVPASGKSTYIEKFAVPGDIVLSRDNFRTYLRQLLDSDKYFPVSQGKEEEAWYALIAETIRDMPNGVDLWIDQTTITIRSLRRLLYGANIPTDAHIGVIHMNIPLEECIERNSKREGFDKVPVDIIKSNYNGYNLSYGVIKRELPEYKDIVWLESFH